MSQIHKKGRKRQEKKQETFAEVRNFGTPSRQPRTTLTFKNPKKVTKGLKISSKILDIRKIWGDKTSFEKNEDRPSVSTIPIPIPGMTSKIET